MPPPSSSAKQRSSSWVAESLTPHSSTPWLRTSRTPAASIACAASATSGVTDCAAFTCVWGARGPPAAPGGGGEPAHALDDVVLEPVLGKAHQRLRRQPDVTHRLDL